LQGDFTIIVRFYHSFVLIVISIKNRTMKNVCIMLLCLLGMQLANAQSDEELIKNTLLDYIIGTSNGEPERIARAFHEDLNLYSVDNDSLRITNGQRYIGYFKKGQKNDRVGTIISIDVVNDAAIAKVEIKSESRKRLYTDYMMLLKIKGHWKIIHKSYTSISY